jgi:hemolysin activation/secretion protein
MRDSTILGLPSQWLAVGITTAANVVEIGSGNSLTQRQTLTTLDLRLNYFILRDGTKFSPRFQLQPDLTLGYSTSNDVTYARFSLVANYHQLIPSTWLEWDHSASLNVATLGTPTVELPEFGGESCVRGFRADATQGRLVWSLQNEVWIPFRVDTGLPDQIDTIIRRNLYLAPFIDVGGVHEATADLEGIKSGAGLGLRATYQSFTFRLDWAHSLTQVANKYGGNTFYFSVSCRPSF